MSERIFLTPPNLIINNISLLLHYIKPQFTFNTNISAHALKTIPFQNFSSNIPLISNQSIIPLPQERNLSSSPINDTSTPSRSAPPAPSAPPQQGRHAAPARTTINQPSRMLYPRLDRISQSQSKGLV